MRTKDYWKGRPKLQAWFKSGEDAEALKQHFARARAAGRTFARAPGGWVTEWLVPAAEAAARGRFPAPAPEDHELAEALRVVGDHLGTHDPVEIHRSLVLRAASALARSREAAAAPARPLRDAVNGS